MFRMVSLKGISGRAHATKSTLSLDAEMTDVIKSTSLTQGIDSQCLQPVTDNPAVSIARIDARGGFAVFTERGTAFAYYW
jgi:hypothetical protein